MDDTVRPENGCCSQDDCRPPSCASHELKPLPVVAADDEVCCGRPPGPQSSSFEKPGYRLLPFVEDFIAAPPGAVPRVKTRLDRSDFLGAAAVRLGIKRDQYKIAPGLYGVGNPGQDSPVLVSANYKLSFDTLRRELTGLDAWVLVLDTRGINVWCAAGKALFSTQEVIQRVKQTQLNTVVRHNRLVLPQLAATGVCAHQVKKQSGFKVNYGPVRAKDIKRFIADGMHTAQSMRRVSFSILERMVLVPVEITHLPKPLIWGLLAVFILSGVGPHFYSPGDAWTRGLMALSAYAGGIVAGAVAAPLLLPWIPGRAFALKGALTGAVAGLAVLVIFSSKLMWLEAAALVLISTVISSYLAMNFTGSTPFTSPSGVEKEMRRAIPLQASVAIIALAAWVGAAFAG